jgi:hypothetical protein
MDNFFCAEHSRQSGVDIIGSASEHQIYVAIECPPPWSTDDMESKGIPDNLRELSETIYEEYDRFQTRFLLIYNEHLKQEHLTRVLFFRKPSGFANVYEKQEFHLNDIQDVAPLVNSYVIGEPIDLLPIGTPTRVDTPTRDILICTHGSRDRCCARFGNPIYHQALQVVEERSLQNIRIWQTSHIGGHRMAPTAITFPDARYYGYLTPESLTSILTQTGKLDWITQQYRGCGMLPWAVQIVERELILAQGWQWFGYRLEGRVLEHNEDESFNQVELIVEMSEDDRQRYTATVLLDDTKTVYLKGSCASEKTSLIEQYQVKALTKSPGVLV